MLQRQLIITLFAEHATTEVTLADDAVTSEKATVSVLLKRDSINKKCPATPSNLQVLNDTNYKSTVN